MDQDSLSYQTLRNSSYLFLGFVLPMVFTIFVTRELTAKLGTSEFGIFILVNAISAFVGYVDFGLSTAITKYVAEYRGRNDITAVQNILSSARVLLFFTGLLGLAVFLILGKWFLPAFHIPEASQSNIFTVFAFTGLVFFFNSLNAVYGSVLTALQRFDLITKLNFANLVFVSIATVVLLKLGFQLKVIMALNAFAAFCMLVLFRYFSHKLMPELRLRFAIEKSEIKKAYTFGLLTFVSNLAGSCLVYFDRLLIPSFLGPSQLAFYSVPGNVALKVPGITNSLAGMLLPMSSQLAGSGDSAKLKTIYIRAFRNLSVVAAALSLSIGLFAHKILLFWLGAEYAARGSRILVILAVTYYIVGLFIPLQSILLGLGKLKFLIRQSLFMATVNLVLLLILVPRYGIVGAAWAYLISVLPMAYAFYWVEHNVFNFGSGQGKYYFKLYAKLLLTAVLSGLIMKFLLLPIVNSVWVLVIVGPFSVALYFMIYYIFRFSEPEDEDIFKSFIKKFLRIN